MNAPLTSQHFYVSDLPDGLELLTDSQHVREVLEQVGINARHNNRGIASVFVRYDDEDILEAYGCRTQFPRVYDEVIDLIEEMP